MKLMAFDIHQDPTSTSIDRQFSLRRRRSNRMCNNNKVCTLRIENKRMNARRHNTHETETFGPKTRTRGNCMQSISQ